MLNVFKQKTNIPVISVFLALATFTLADVNAACGKTRYVCCVLPQRINFGEMEEFLAEKNRLAFLANDGQLNTWFRLDENDRDKLSDKRTRGKHDDKQALCLAVVQRFIVFGNTNIRLFKKKARRVCRDLGGTVDTGAGRCRGKWHQKLTWIG